VAEGIAKYGKSGDKRQTKEEFQAATIPGSCLGSTERI